jgi:hypothetical protein
MCEADATTLRIRHLDPAAGAREMQVGGTDGCRRRASRRVTARAPGPTRVRWRDRRSREPQLDPPRTSMIRPTAPIHGACKRLPFRPQGGIEGALVDVRGAAARVTVPPHVGAAPAVAVRCHPGCADAARRASDHSGDPRP